MWKYCVRQCAPIEEMGLEILPTRRIQGGNCRLGRQRHSGLTTLHFIVMFTVPAGVRVLSNAAFQRLNTQQAPQVLLPLSGKSTLPG